MNNTERGKVFTGARAILKINQIPIGYATGVNWTESLNYEEINVLGKLSTQEHVPVSYRVAGSFSHVRVISQSLKASGFFPKHGVSDSAHLRNVLTNGSVTMTIEDQGENGLVIASMEEVRLTQIDNSISEGTLVQNGVNFVAIRVKDESEV